MKIPLPIDCRELSQVDTPPCPQTHVDLASIDYRKAQLGSRWRKVLELYMLAWFNNTLKQGRN